MNTAQIENIENGVCGTCGNYLSRCECNTEQSGPEQSRPDHYWHRKKLLYQISEEVSKLLIERATEYQLSNLELLGIAEHAKREIAKHERGKDSP